MNLISKQIMDHTSVSSLNELPASLNFLVMLRILNTSDLAFCYMIFKPETLLDIANNAARILQDEMEHNCHGLTIEEVTEFLDYCQTLREYAEKYPNAAS